MSSADVTRKAKRPRGGESQILNEKIPKKIKSTKKEESNFYYCLTSIYLRLYKDLIALCSKIYEWENP